MTVPPIDHEEARRIATTDLRLDDVDCVCAVCRLARAYLDLSAKSQAFFKESYCSDHDAGIHEALRLCLPKET